MFVKNRVANEKLKLIRILVRLFIANMCLARAGRVEHSNNCEPTITKAFGTGGFL